MTLFVPLVPTVRAPSSPSFLQDSVDHAVQLEKVIKAILKAKRMVIVCGAGISVQAGIPDFRSPEGLFQTLKRDNPREALASGKDLFDASVFHNSPGIFTSSATIYLSLPPRRRASVTDHSIFQSENTTSLFCQMIARLSVLSRAAEPTPFHHLLRTLDARGKLLRVYTQNIDAIEQKSGLSFGVPPFQEKRSKPRTPKAKSKSNPPPDVAPEAEPVPAEKVASSSRPPTPPAETPRCIPLHGTLQSVHCQVCNHSYALTDHLESLVLGTPAGRARGVGRLRPSVVLYNEAHKDGEGVGDVVRRDLLGLSKGKGRSGADLLLVVGTSLRVQGTKRMVREFSKAVRARGKDGAGSNCPSPAPATAAVEEEPPVKTVYLNLDFPVPTREWEGVFDTWLQGDAQLFAEKLQAEIDKETSAKEAAREKKRRKEEEDVECGGKRKPPPTQSAESPKRRKIASVPAPLTPPPSTTTPTTPSTKLYLTIPARPRRLVPEVFITSVRPSARPCLPPTPENSPPRPARKPLKTGHRNSVRCKGQTAIATEAAADAELHPPLRDGLRTYGLRSRSSSRSRPSVG
ncbi:DHS-like NAD/FAD-binding domain-containing protein [Mycena belliarum]|uniref:DHS-like NAD/FAD-binding domain-containing protein n=1 Tax=Mycena belliarum TaxID=1033014 RepID=A0AAD6XQY2_9AGAR|nr:DHS-like NAD/FAD-binding domain-containing protein [Mycena belliae]